MARPRTIDTDRAARALKSVFWDKGFERTSVTDIEVATGLSRQSLYRAFGDKRGMYRKALAAYADDEMRIGVDALAAPGTRRERVARVFDAALSELDRRGCFLWNASAEAGTSGEWLREDVRQILATSIDAFERALMASPTLRRQDARRRRLASTLRATHYGLRVMIAAGMSRHDLECAAAGAVELVPDDQ